MFTLLKKHVLLWAASTTLATSLLALPAQAQQNKSTVGIANLGPHPSIAVVIEGFKKEMAQLGWVEGTTVHYEYGDANFTQSLMPQKAPPCHIDFNHLGIAGGLVFGQ